MRVLMLCVVVSVLALGLMGCGQAEQEQAEESTETATEAVEEAVTEAPMVDPVCAMEVTAESEWTAEYEGATFYFCSESCRDAFVEEPGKYLEATDEEVSDT